MKKFVISVLRETISDLKRLILLEAHKSKNEELMDRFRLLQSEEDTLIEPKKTLRILEKNDPSLILLFSSDQSSWPIAQSLKNKLISENIL